MAQTIRQKAEALLREEYPVEALAQDEDLLQILRELRLYQIELELQNDELRRTQQELQKTQKKYFDLYDFAPVGYFTFDVSGVVVDVNFAGTEMLQRPKQYVIDKPMLVHFDTISRPLFFNHLDRVFQTKTRQSCELTLRNSYGDHIPVRLESIAADEDDQLCCRSVMTDITPLKEAEAALAEEKERLTVTLRSIGDGVIATDTAGCITLMNEVAELLTGWSQREALGQPLPKIFNVINEITGEPGENPVEKVLVTGRRVAVSNHTVLVARDGTKRILTDSGAPIRDTADNIIGAVLVFRDITDQREIEAELQKAQKLESVGVLAGGIAHDFNNILTAILGNITLARLALPPNEKAVERLEKAETATLNARHLTQQLLTFAKGGNPVKEAASIPELIKASVDFAISGSKVRPEYHLNGNLWPVEVDQGQINQVIHNLIINADQAMPHGGTITIKAKNIQIVEGDNLPLPLGDYVSVSVQDNGIGISKENLLKIFDPYFSTKETGNGLGLAICYSIIEKHGGHITVESELDLGTTFTIYLPAATHTLALTSTLDNSQAVVNGPVLEAVTSQTRQVLVMEDEEMVATLLIEILHYLGYQGSWVSTGESAISLYKETYQAGQPFHTVIMDLTIPGGMGGRETVEKLLEFNPNLKAIVSSGYSNDPVLANYQQFGFYGVITKPYQIKEVKEILQSINP